MGRPKGSKNLRTQYDIYKREVGKLRGDQFVGESLAFMGEAMNFFIQMARAADTPEDARIYYNDALNAGEKLAPFRYARLASVRVGIERNDALSRETVAERELLAELVAELVETNGVPRQVKAYLEANSANNGDGNSAMKGANGGGVANREDDA